jgi:hypothetical protein
MEAMVWLAVRYTMTTSRNRLSNGFVRRSVKSAEKGKKENNRNSSDETNTASTRLSGQTFTFDLRLLRLSATTEIEKPPQRRLLVLL